MLPSGRGPGSQNPIFRSNNSLKRSVFGAEKFKEEYIRKFKYYEQTVNRDPSTSEGLIYLIRTGYGSEPIFLESLKEMQKWNDPLRELQVLTGTDGDGFTILSTMCKRFCQVSTVKYFLDYLLELCNKLNALEIQKKQSNTAYLPH